MTPGAPLGLLTNAVQTLAGVLLPSATVFLLLLCNDKAVLGPWTNGRGLNLFAGTVIAGLVLLSLILTASVLFPAIGSQAILAILCGGAALGMLVWVGAGLLRRSPDRPPASARLRRLSIVYLVGAARLRRLSPTGDEAMRQNWRMPPLAELPPLKLGTAERVWLVVLRGYLFVAVGLVLARIVALAVAGG